MTTITEADVVDACRTLFGNEVDISSDFLSSVQPSGAKSAYRRKAKETHPDLFAAAPLPIRQKKTALFREILRAYNVLNLFFEERERGAWSPARRGPRSPEQGRENGQTSLRAGQAGARRGDSRHYRGNVPLRALQIGQYLYYRGRISFDMLISALIWQRKQRPPLGAIALRWGLLDACGIEKISRACDRPRRFGEKAVNLGLLTIFQVNMILRYQRSRQDRLGNYFVSNNILSSCEVERLVSELKEHNAGIPANVVKADRNQGVFARSTA